MLNNVRLFCILSNPTTLMPNQITKIKALDHPVYAGKDSLKELDVFLKSKKYQGNNIFILTDQTVSKYCLPVLLKNTPVLKRAKVITISPGEEYKNIKTCEF